MRGPGVGRRTRFTAVTAGIALAVAAFGGSAFGGSALAAPSGTTTTTAAGPASVVRDPHGDREPSGTEVRGVDGTNVVFSYGEVMPSFDGYARHEPTRRYLSLDRTWRFRYDPDNQGLTAGWQQPGADDSAWDSIAVPSSWDLKDNDGWAGYDGADFGKGGALKDGYAWYRTKVAVPASWRGTHVRLAFLAASYSADVWVNGTFAGKHEGGHTAFALPVGDALRPGQPATIAVRVYRRASYTSYDGTGEKVSDDKALPPGVVDYWPYAGLTRSVWLESVPEVNVAKVLLDAKKSTLDARVVVQNSGDTDFNGYVRIDPGRGSTGRPTRVRVDVPAGGVAVPSARIAVAGAPHWSVAHPRVLTARASVTATADGRPVDTLAATYGVREIRVDGTQLTLDGSPLFLKGTNWHEETDRSGRSMTRAEYDHELGQVKAADANFLRNCVYNRHPYVYDWADRHGLMLMDEWDTMWVGTDQQKLQTESYGLSRALALATAWNNHNHPSVILWGLQNESTIDGDGAPVYRAWLADMKAAVKAVDLSRRPVTWASYSSWDPAFDLADVVGFNEYFGYFYGKNSDLGTTLDAVHRNHPDKPILVTENGTWSYLGKHGSPAEGGTEEWQAANFVSHWDQVTAPSRPWMAGYAFWVLKDYKERAAYNQDYNGLSTMGMLGWDGTTRRAVFDAFAEARSPR
ncbi:beta-glucuronidase [Actinopolymorpha cephalotaxi]|uniref:Beta-glucuronidase n=1 Tax=Actinopolymorpha cephalotaxi TaxID=504797 RepID=A0A1I2KJR0_9ACTN|nr:glycoside hydrolase family 2 TIM barrel-domain containing protein [Actinopolymorpha cephalotaxi]NYH81170.1 beta-glucuronidase [Actinopolymorpha cephalotaxi]SFF65497.1 beta-glucuronidase [Actinopolymorpha cephalotaxi]